jgi:hypothetical protein
MYSTHSPVPEVRADSNAVVAIGGVSTRYLWVPAVLEWGGVVDLT